MMMIKIHQVVKVNCHATSYYHRDIIISTVHVEGDLNQEKKGLCILFTYFLSQFLQKSSSVCRTEYNIIT